MNTITYSSRDERNRLEKHQQTFIRKPFFNSSDPTATSGAFSTRPPLWLICQEKIQVYVEREKKNQVLVGKPGVVLSRSVKAPSITLLPLRATDTLNTRAPDSKENVNKRDFQPGENIQCSFIHLHAAENT